MNRRIQILDCTLRDGGRCFSNAWGDETIRDMIDHMVKSRIDIIEVGFLWYVTESICRENTTLFNSMEEITPFLQLGSEYVIYIEYELFKKENHIIPERANVQISGIRLGILKEDMYDAIETMKEIKRKGYKLFVQGINTLSYTDEELVEFVEIVNKVKADAFAIVDTYGSMYMSTLRAIFILVDKYLNKDIYIDFHAHNNVQLALALAITLLELSQDRNIIIDSTLGGIGMGAGNLATELIVKYLNEQFASNYNLSAIIKLIDKYIIKIKKKYSWDSNLLTYDSAIKWASQINVSYIINAYDKISLEDKRFLLGMLPPGYGVGKHKIDYYYRILQNENSDTNKNLIKLKELIVTKKILIIAKGPSINENKNEIENYINSNDISIIFLNYNHTNDFVSTKVSKLYFFSNIKSYNSFKMENTGEIIVCLSSISKNDDEIYINLKELSSEGNVITDNSTIIVLNLLNKICKNKDFIIAGFDGTDASIKQIELYKKYLNTLRKNNNINFLTNSLYD